MSTPIQDGPNNVVSQHINLSKLRESKAFDQPNKQSTTFHSNYIQENSLINSMQINDSMNYFPYGGQETSRPLAESTVIEARKETDNAIQTIIDKYLKSPDISQNSNDYIQPSHKRTPTKDNKHSTMFTNNKLEGTPIRGMSNQKITIGNLTQSKIGVASGYDNICSDQPEIKYITQEKSNSKSLNQLEYKPQIHHQIEEISHQSLYRTIHYEPHVINASYFPRSNYAEELKPQNTYINVAVPTVVEYEKRSPVVVEHRNYNLKPYVDKNLVNYETEYIRFENYLSNVVVGNKAIPKDDFGIEYMKQIPDEPVLVNQALLQDLSKTAYDSKYIPISIENERLIQEYLSPYKREVSLYNKNVDHLMEQSNPKNELNNEIEKQKSAKKFALPKQLQLPFSSNYEQVIF